MASCKEGERRFGYDTGDAGGFRHDSFDVGLQFFNSVLKTVKRLNA